MSYEIHIYLGTACTTSKSNYNYPEGERHAFLLYLKAEESSEIDYNAAEDTAIDNGLINIEFSKAGKLDKNKLNNQEKLEYYNDAMEVGSTLIVYSEPIEK